jgi:glucose-1-phosphate adenylyltransferase
MNYRALLEQHVSTGAEVTVATTQVRPEAARAFGILQVAGDGRVTRFVEKPTDPGLLASLRVDWSTVKGLEEPVDPDSLPASMGIYVFDRAVLADALSGNEADLGKHVIPRLIDTRRVFAFQHQGYWEDIGTIRSFYEAISTSARRCRSSTSTTRPRRFTPTRGTCRRPRSSRAGSSSRS